MSADRDKKISISLNGKLIDDPAQLPPEMQKLVIAAEEAALSKAAGSDQSLDVKLVEQVYSVDGKTYNSLEEMPPDLRDEIQKALASSATPAAPAAPRATAGSLPGPGRTNRPRSVGPSWTVIVLAAVIAALLAYILLRR